MREPDAEICFGTIPTDCSAPVDLAFLSNADGWMVRDVQVVHGSSAFAVTLSQSTSRYRAVSVDRSGGCATRISGDIVPLGQPSGWQVARAVAGGGHVAVDFDCMGNRDFSCGRQFHLDGEFAFDVSEVGDAYAWYSPPFAMAVLADGTTYVQTARLTAADGGELMQLMGEIHSVPVHAWLPPAYRRGMPIAATDADAGGELVAPVDVESVHGVVVLRAEGDADGGGGGRLELHSKDDDTVLASAVVDTSIDPGRGAAGGGTVALTGTTVDGDGQDTWLGLYDATTVELLNSASDATRRAIGVGVSPAGEAIVALTVDRTQIWFASLGRNGDLTYVGDPLQVDGSLGTSFDFDVGPEGSLLLTVDDR